jgi:hypothetical protein
MNKQMSIGRDAECIGNFSQRKLIIDARVRHQIGERLRAMYSDIVAQGVSTRLTELLKQLDEQEHKGHS